MGLCFSGQIKAHSPYYSGSVPKYESTHDGETEIISSSTKVSSSHSGLPTLHNEGVILLTSNLRNFSFVDLKVATRNFRPESVLGEGRLGYVFKGCVDEQTPASSNLGSGMVIAVKRFKHKKAHGHSEWLAHVNILGQLRHPNLVKLVGYCIEDDQRLLVNEFVPRGSLENHLFRRGSYFQHPSWSLRLKVALGAAKGHAFLHSREASVIYNNFKTSSILLDLNYNAKLSDFGLARDEPDDEEGHICARVVGTHEYAAPEYITMGHLTAKSNVYSFGVILLEILSGRRALDMNRPSKEISLVEWAKPYLASKRKVIRVLDNRLEGQYTINAAHNAAMLALRCISTEAKCRPSMDHIVNILEELYDLNEVPPTQTKPSPGQNAQVHSQAKSAHAAKNVQRRKNSVA